MFGGVGIPSAKGTGTNGYVERALGYLPKDYKPGSYGEIIRQMKANPAPIKRKINDDIILHEEKHKIEVELYDLKEKYENEKKYSPEEIKEKINQERKRLYHVLERREADFMDKNETHQKGKLKDAQMKIIRDALKIKKEYYLGEGFEFTLQTDESKKKKHKKEHRKKHHREHKSSEYKDHDEISEYKRKKKLSEDNYDSKHDRKYDNYDYEKRKRKYWKSKGYRYSHSRSRSRSSSKNYNKNIRNEINNDYRQNKKIKLVESVFKHSPSPKKNDSQKEKITEEKLYNENEKNKNEKSENLNNNELNIENKNNIDDTKNDNNNIAQKSEEYEHEEGSIEE